MSNFSIDKQWREYYGFRYSKKDIYSTNNIDIVDRQDFFECAQLFSFKLEEEDFSLISKLVNIKPIKFKYINYNSTTHKKLENFIKSNNLIDIENFWNNPVVLLQKGQLFNYLKNGQENIFRNFKKYMKNKSNLNFVNNKDCNSIVKLWNSILEIDQKSWKADEGSDMLSLEYEHISYITYSLTNPNNVFIDVLYDDNNKPIGYSFILKYKKTYYAAKWGATEEGRIKNAGINCFFRQLERINKKQDMYLDTWSRNNMFFEKISNKLKKRTNIEIKSNVNN